MATPEDSYLVDQAPNGNSLSSGLYQVSTQTYNEQNVVVPAYQEPQPQALSVFFRAFRGGGEFPPP